MLQGAFSKKIILLVVGILLVASIWEGISIWKKSEQARLVEEYRVLSNQAEEAHKQGDTVTSIAFYREMVTKSQRASANEVIYAKHLLAYDLFVENYGDDRKEAAKILREMIQDNTLTPLVRALSMNELLDFYYTNQDEKFAREEIFQGEPLASFLKDDNVGIAVAEALRYSDSLSPAPYSSLRLAQWYGKVLEKNKESLSNEKRGAYFTELRKWTEKGKTLLLNNQSQESRYKKSRLGLIYAIDGRNRVSLGDLTTNEKLRQANYTFAESAYKKSLTILAPEDEANTYKAGLFVRFYYASLLAKKDGDKRLGDIKMLLEPLIRTPERFASLKNVSFFDEFLKGQILQDYQSSQRNDIALLERLVPEFRDALVARDIRIPNTQ